jgi:hypothetical protein
MTPPSEPLKLKNEDRSGYYEMNEIGIIIIIIVIIIIIPVVIVVVVVVVVVVVTHPIIPSLHNTS